MPNGRWVSRMQAEQPRDFRRHIKAIGESQAEFLSHLFTGAQRSDDIDKLTQAQRVIMREKGKA